MAENSGATIVIRGLTLGFDPVVLAADINVTVAPGHVLGLVGPNGAGKSTFLKCLAGIESPLAGTVSTLPPNASIGYLPQEVHGDLDAATASSPSLGAGEGTSATDLAGDNTHGSSDLGADGTRHGGISGPNDGDADETIMGFLARRTGVGPATVAMESAADQMASGDPDAVERYGEYLDRWLALGGADFEARTAAVLSELGLAAPADQPLRTLSGGQAGRVGLASLLLARFDVFLLDEPTNNLDLEGLSRLEDLVKSMRAACVIVSHDRAFLEATATSILELDPREQRGTVFGGGYASYLEEREVARAHAREAYDAYADKRADLLGRARTVRNWTFEGVKKASKKTDNDKIGAKKRAESSEKQAAKAGRLEKAAERLDEVAEPRKVWTLQYSIASAARSGKFVAGLTDAVVERFDANGTRTYRFGPTSLDVSAGDRILITGPNGGGKSTLLGALLGRVPLTSGQSRLGSGVALGELDQARGLFDNDGSLLDAVRQNLPELTIPDIRTLLAKFGLGSDDVRRRAATLSPGERTRAVLALFQAKGVNCLVLDEPTNHLDLEAIEQLEQALSVYDGTLLLVTHDRRMLEQITTTRRLHVEDGQVREVS